MWFGISLLGLCVVLWVVGGLLTRRAVTKRGTASAAAAGTRPAVGTGSTPAKVPTTKAATPKSATPKSAKGKAPAQEVDPEMAEIEAILKNRGIN